MCILYTLYTTTTDTLPLNTTVPLRAHYYIPYLLQPPLLIKVRLKHGINISTHYHTTHLVLVAPFIVLYQRREEYFKRVWATAYFTGLCFHVPFSHSLVEALACQYKYIYICICIYIRPLQLVTCASICLFLKMKKKKFTVSNIGQTQFFNSLFHIRIQGS